MLVDTHVHVVSRDLSRYPLRPNDPSLTWFTEHACPAEEFTGLMAANGVERAVLVQALGAYSDDNRYTVDSANADPGRFTAVVYVESANALARWAGEGATGVRVVAGTGMGRAAVDDPSVVELVSLAAELDVRVLLMTFADSLPRVGRLLDRVGDIPVAIDHCAFPDLRGGPPYPNARPLFELAALPSVHVKVSTNALDQATKAGGDPRDFVAALAEAYGPERLQWGSDWSQTHDRSYAELVAHREQAFSVLPPDQRHWAEGDAARRFWRWNG